MKKRVVMLWYPWSGGVEGALRVRKSRSTSLKLDERRGTTSGKGMERKTESTVRWWENQCAYGRTVCSFGIFVAFGDNRKRKARVMKYESSLAVVSNPVRLLHQ